MKRGTNLDKERFLQKVEISSNVFLIIGIFVVFGLLAFMLYDLSITGNIILDSENTNLGTNLTNTNSTTTNFTNTNSTINNSTINNSTTTNLTGALMSNESLEVDSGIGIDFPKITGDVIAAEEVKENTVEELTVIEYFVSSFEMDVIVYMPYELRNEDILAFANLSSLVFINETDTINLFWINADSRELTEFTAIDSNKDFVIDYIEWVVPYSPNQTYEIIIDHEICDNSVDDDSDSLVDCLDKDCDEDISCLVVCDLTDAFWNLTSVDEGTTVDLILFANESCNGKFVNFEIFEDDGIFPDDFMDVNLYPIEIVDGRAVISWETEYEDDSFLRISRNPEYYFVATLVDDGDIDITSSGGLLEVTEIGISEGEICGNGIIEDGEACDDGNNVSGADGCYWNCQLQPGYDCIGEIGELSSCSFMGEECGFGQDSEVIMVWAYPNGATVSGNTNIGIVAYHQNGIKNITFYVDDVLADTVMTETINPDTNEYEYVFVMDTTEYADDTSYNITATGYPNCGLSVALFEELMVQVDNSPTYNIIYVDAINGDDANPGTTTQPVKTIKEGLNLAESGDTIILLILLM